MVIFIAGHEHRLGTGQFRADVVVVDQFIEFHCCHTVLPVSYTHLLRVSGQAPPLPARRPARAVRHEQRGAVPAPAQENSSGIFSGALASMLSGVEERPPGRRAQDHEPGPAGPAGAHGGNLIAGKGRYIAHVIESAAINRKSEEVNR